MALRRGFKSEANWYAREMRKELGIPPCEKLCPWELAEHLGCKLIRLTDLHADAPSAVSHFLNKAPKEFSAAALDGGMILHNDSHSLKRQASNIAHELSHKLLIHPPIPLADASGRRIYKKSYEDEANWLGPALLISEEAALHIIEDNLSVSQASDYYGVTEQIVQMRVNVIGAVARVSRRKVA